MGFIRSEDMYLYKFLITKDNAYQTIKNLGKANAVHFLNMNKNEQVLKLPYTEIIKRCEESERRINLLQDACKKYKVQLITPQVYEHLEDSLITISRNKKKSLTMLFEEAENEIKSKQEFVASQNERVKVMHDVLIELIEYRIVLEKAHLIIHGQIVKQNVADSFHTDHEGQMSLRSQQSSVKKRSSMRNHSLGINNVDLEENKENPFGEQVDSNFREVSIRYMSGTINKDEVMRFKRILFRTSRGKVLQYFEDFDSPLRDFAGNILNKVVYVLVFEEGSHIKERIATLCDSFQGKRFHLPNQGQGDIAAFKRKIDSIDKKIRDTKQMVKLTKDQMKLYLEGINQSEGVAFSMFEVYRLFIMKEKSIYQTMNMLQREGNFYHGFMWSFLTKHQLLQELYRVSNNNNNSNHQSDQSLQLEEIAQNKIKPPTFIQTNAFTSPFQEIIDTYGVPSYKEINPAFFTCVTFPFLFGIMFGDIGHGTVLLLIGIFLCTFNVCLKHRVSSVILKARYMILLMGLFATFCGFIYNDMMSIPLFIFESCYNSQTGLRAATANTTDNCVYPFGVDPIWYLSKNELLFMNSLKMKMAVIIGVLQMSLGVWMKAINLIYRKNNLDLVHEFLPQILLLTVLFGYMDFLIILKWLTNYTGNEQNAPSIVGAMINIALSGGKVAPGQSLIGSETTNQAISVSCLIIALICAPWMLYAKPFILKQRHKEYSMAPTSLSGVSGENEIELRDLSQSGANSNSDAAEKNYNVFVEEEKDNDGNGGIGVKDEVLSQTFVVVGAPGHINEQSFIERVRNEDILLEITGQKDTHGDEFVFTEVFIHQMIETIEFVLGTISNTASYLRLWALSLAHSQLALVFYENSIEFALKNDSVIGLIVSYMVWISATIFVLMFMDVMECFLHTLRLHWVEFQNKFYKGQGYRFAPFNFERLFM